MFVRTQFHTDAPGTTISANTSTPMPNSSMLHLAFISGFGFARRLPPRWPEPRVFVFVFVFLALFVDAIACPIPLYVPGAAQTPRRMDFSCAARMAFAHFAH